MAINCPKELLSDFNNFLIKIEKTREKREAIIDLSKELNICARKITGCLQIIHYNFKQTEEACVRAREVFIGIRAKYCQIRAILQVNDYYRFQPIWRPSTLQLCFLSMLIIYLEKGELGTPQDVADVMGLKVIEETSPRLTLAIEVYFNAFILLTSELSRLAVSCGSQGNFDKSMDVCTFVLQTAGNIRQLNVHNEVLRKKIHNLKHDVIKVETTMYDLKVKRILHSDPERVRMLRSGNIRSKKEEEKKEDPKENQ